MNGSKSPTAEHLEEPSVVGKRENQQVVSDASKPSANEDPNIPQNIRIADMLKN